MTKGQRKKILFVIPSLGMGGAERLTVYLLQKLNRNNFDIALCLFERRGGLLENVPTDIKIYDLKKKNRWSFFRMLYSFNKIVKEYDPDLIYTRMWYATSVATFSKKCCSFKTPIITNEEHNHKQDINSNDVLGKVKKIFMNWSHKNAEMVIVPSKGVKENIATSYGIELGKIKTIYNSVDLDLVKRAINENDYKLKDYFKDDNPVIVVFGRLIVRKGFSDLLNAFKLVVSKRASHLVFIGEGEERSKLKSLATKLDLDGYVKFLGYQKNPFGYISQSDVFVLASHWEGFGNVIIEAMACGVPVISTDCPYGPNEIITNEVNGLLVPVGDTDAMAEAILKLLKDELLRKRLAKAGKKRAQDFRVEKMIAEYERVFEEYAHE